MLGDRIPMDKDCPNSPAHGPRHLQRTRFLELLQAQLAVDRGYDAGSTALYINGAVGALFKVRLTSHGYTIVAKGVEPDYLGRLQHEAMVYERLSDMQGTYIPVCVGIIDLVLPYYYDGGEFEHFMILSWAGKPLARAPPATLAPSVVCEIRRAYAEMHRRGVLHQDAAARNIVYDTRPMIVDFERSTIVQRRPSSPPPPPLGEISANSRASPKRRKRGAAQKEDESWGKDASDEFEKELRRIVSSVSDIPGLAA